MLSRRDKKGRLMRVLTSVLAGAALFLAACDVPEEALSQNGNPLPKVYRIANGQTATIQFRMLDAINTLRGASELDPIELDPALNAAAATHARDMSLQNRPWHFGSDGSSPLDRANRVGYDGLFLGENISETYETELETLSAWMGQPDTRNVIMDPRADDLGFAWYQEPSGKLWWTLVTGQEVELIEEPSTDEDQG